MRQAVNERTALRGLLASLNRCATQLIRTHPNVQAWGYSVGAFAQPTKSHGPKTIRGEVTERAPSLHSCPRPCGLIDHRPDRSSQTLVSL